MGGLTFDSLLAQDQVRLAPSPFEASVGVPHSRRPLYEGTLASNLSHSDDLGTGGMCW